MEKEYNLSTSQANTENTNPKSIGPSSNELKNRFKEGSIPLQTDYSDLIDIADIGRRSVGKAPDQTDNPNSGLELDNSSGLLVKVNPTGGLRANKDGLSVKLKDKSLLTDTNGLSVNYGKGLQLDKDNDNKLTINNHDGIEIVDGGVKVKAGNGITVNSSGVSIDPNTVLPKGIIVMFSGNSAPTGWAFCDGNNGTPDLRSRFIMCGETISETGKSSSKASGSGSEKNYSRNTTSTQVSVTVNVENTTLTESQIPNHNHIGGMGYWVSNGMKYGPRYYGDYTSHIRNDINSVMQSANGAHYAYTSSTGGGQGHNHPATAKVDPALHNHSVDIIPPYFLLAFIMKL
ncbi:tail fiber protein [Photorhabdus caribbeanensis]|uniref:tail fiber protein n=1 Tax=Photorhabdus caribbeanensis TaxID=1004165 RepID=UPI001BD25A19|nr:tail fiber protein [Photorhabdus caribbeanensis]MBS9423177.1 tail fiber protein [Photorhabdus caribbeanensis]